MHGQRRDKYKARLKDEKVADALQAKATQWFQVSNVLVQKRHEEKDTNGKTTMNLVEKLLLVNPDPIYLWNHRRDLLLKEEQDQQTGACFELEPELILTRQALERNPKAYGPWFHRKWAIRQYLLKQKETNYVLVQQETQKVLQTEIALTEQFLMLDERNFHCWNYRRFLIGCQLQLLFLKQKLMNPTFDTTLVVFDGHWPKCFVNIPGEKKQKTTKMMSPQVAIDRSTARKIAFRVNLDGRPGDFAILDLYEKLIQQEWDFTTKKMTQNFSNGSALHYRLLLLGSWKKKKDDDDGEDLLSQELELCHDAIFTEPDDQTTWWYYKELLKMNGICNNSKVLQKEQDLLLELLESEDNNCKWAWIGLDCVLEKQQELLINDDDKKKEKDEIKEQRMKAYENLIRLDPDRQNRYRCLMQTL